MTEPPSLAAILADHYRIVRELGAGGMATVYLAHDVKHDRQVAIKAVRPELAAVLGAERFLREITTTAQLQHPNILPLFDSGSAGGLLYYVMPYVEGETLRARIDRETQLGVVEAVRIATEVAEALQYAHDHGVIHRDVKPENILLHAGRPLVADFGIALAVSAAGGGRLTETGLTLGTPHYMSPEQAIGEKTITSRTDIYSLGAVLYEMLTGTPPHTGANAQQLIMKIVTEEAAPIETVRKAVPPHVTAAVARALEKLPADRFATAAEFAAALADTQGTPRVATGRAQPAAAAVTAWRRRFLMAAGIAAAAVAAALWGWAQVRALADAPTTWETITLGDSVHVTVSAPGLALSPDGATLVVRDDRLDGVLWVKQRSAPTATSLAGSERASLPAFSPDGEWLLYVADGQLRKVQLSTGAAIHLADSISTSAGLGGATWLEDGSIVYVPAGLSKLVHIDANGGSPTVVLDNRDVPGVGFRYPTALPGSRGVLFQGCSSGCTTMSLRVLDLRTGVQRILVNEATSGWYLPTGHLLWARRDGVLLAAPFDLGKLELTGTAQPVLDGVRALVGAVQLAWSPSGTLVYASGGGRTAEATVVRVGTDGVASVIDSGWTGAFTSLALSPDGRQVAVGAGAGAGTLNIWTKRLDRGPLVRASFGGVDRRPVWSPDGKRLAFIRDTLGSSVVMARPVDGSRPDSIALHIDRQVQEINWSPDGKWLVVRTDNGTAGAGDLVGKRTSGDTTAVPLVDSPFTELNPAISPDGRWLAYASNESGQNEVFVRPFPNTRDARWQVSNGGGFQPRWSPDGRTIYFIDPGAGQFMAAAVTTAPSFASGAARPLFSTAGFLLDGFQTTYEVAPDGRHFLFLAPHQDPTASAAPQLVRAEHWFHAMQARLRQ